MKSQLCLHFTYLLFFSGAMLYDSLNIKEILSAHDFKNFIFQVKRKPREIVLVSPQKCVWGTLSYISLDEIHYQ